MLDPESFVALESIQEPEKCVGVEDNGSMKAAENCTSSDNHAMFGIHLIVRLRHICCYFIFAWDFSLAMKAIARLMFPRQQQFSDAKRSTYRYSYNTLDFEEKKRYLIVYVPKKSLYVGCVEFVDGNKLELSDFEHG